MLTSFLNQTDISCGLRSLASNLSPVPGPRRHCQPGQALGAWTGSLSGVAAEHQPASESLARGGRGGRRPLLPRPPGSARSGLPNAAAAASPAARTLARSPLVLMAVAIAGAISNNPRPGPSRAAGDAA